MEWKGLFGNLTVAERVKLLEEWYKEKITISGQSISYQCFAGALSKNKNFEKALKKVCAYSME